MLILYCSTSANPYSHQVVRPATGGARTPVIFGNSHIYIPCLQQVQWRPRPLPPTPRSDTDKRCMTNEQVWAHMVMQYNGPALDEYAENLDVESRVWDRPLSKNNYMVMYEYAYTDNNTSYEVIMEYLSVSITY
jgi:hypothetical protein